MKAKVLNKLTLVIIMLTISLGLNKVEAVKIDTKSHVEVGEEVLVTVDFEENIAAYDSYRLTYNDTIMKYNSPYELIEGLWWDTSYESNGINKKVYSFTALGNGQNTIKLDIKGLVSANYEMDELGDIEVEKKMVVGNGITLGDVNGNGVINSDDSALILDMYRYGNITEDDLNVADIDKNGTINSDDAAQVLDMYRYGN